MGRTLLSDPKEELMRQRILMTSAALTVELGATGIAAAQDRYRDTAKPERPAVQNQQSGDRSETSQPNRDTTGQGPSASSSSASETQNSQQPRETAAPKRSQAPRSKGAATTGQASPNSASKGLATPNGAADKGANRSIQTRRPVPNRTRRANRARAKAAGVRAAQQQPAQGNQNAQGQASQRSEQAPKVQRLSASLKPAQKQN